MRVIGLTGKKRVGKDTAAKILCERLNLKQIAFADPIRSMLDGLPIDPRYKEDKLEVIPWLGLTYTDLCQSLGTGWGRNLVNRQLWVDVANQQVLKAKEEGYRGVVFSDVRYNNEAAFIVSKMEGLVYSVEGPRGVVYNEHSSEIPLHPMFIYGTIWNKGTIEELDSEIETIFPH